MFCKGMCGEWGAEKKGMKGVAKSPRVYSFREGRGRGRGGQQCRRTRARARNNTRCCCCCRFGVVWSSRVHHVASSSPARHAARFADPIIERARQRLAPARRQRDRCSRVAARSTRLHHRRRARVAHPAVVPSSSQARLRQLHAPTIRQLARARPCCARQRLRRPGRRARVGGG